MVKLKNGKFVGNLISGKGKSFIEVDQRDACSFSEPEDAERLAAEHGAKNFTIIDTLGSE